MSQEDTITIPRERFRALLKSEYKLMLLEGGGVDNWQGWDDSLNPDFGDPDQPNFSDAEDIIDAGEWDE